MSYLGPLRLHFAGKFQAAVSTVNNDPSHYDNATFKAEYQEPGNTKGWWNPRGDADWRLIGCAVKAAFLADGSPAAAADPVLSMTVADSDRLPPAKLVDLDPCQQMVSTVWGLEMRLANAGGNTLLRGSFEPVGFFDIWDRAKQGSPQHGDVDACAMYQSVLRGAEWGDVSGSPFLTALKAATPDGILSVKFNVDGYKISPTDPEFTLGRIVGTIGPGSAAEPAHLTVGRQFAAEGLPNANFFRPKGGVNFCAAVVDAAARRIHLDLGNALPTTDPGGPIEDIGKLRLRAGTTDICPVPYAGGDWYERSAGVMALPADRPLTEAELAAVSAEPLSLWVEGAGAAAIAETPDYVRADAFVFRCDPGDSPEVRFHVSRLGKPLAGAEVLLRRDPGGLQPPPQVAAPEAAIKFPAAVTSGADGVAVATVQTADPGFPRVYIDGQVYAIKPVLATDPATPANQWNFVSLLVWSEFTSADPPTWYGDLQPIFQQYANLYPVMQAFLDLSSYEDVCANRKLLLLAFELDISDPNSMPVTRDLSTKKRAAILKWLRDVGPDGKPLLGQQPTPLARPAVAAATAEPELDPMLVLQGGKTAAAARRLAVVEGRVP